ncbi:hypothetical protein PTKIN_Ptkin10aG0158400 [Pterospermum kingtungense]
MEKLGALVVIFLVAMPMAHCDINEGAKEVDEWFDKLPYAKEKVTKFHFFKHEAYGGPNLSLTAIRVAQANFTNQTQSQFGAVYIMDDVLREGMSLTSKELGRAQGLYTFSGQKEMSFLEGFTLVFTTGAYNGSTLTVLGRARPVTYREMPVIGGSGVFRLARGVVSAKLRNLNVTGKAVEEYHVVVLHY